MIIIGFYKVIFLALSPFILIALIVQIATAGQRHQDYQIKQLERQNRLKKAQSRSRTIKQENFIREAKTDMEKDYYENGQAYKEFQRKHR